MLAYSIFRKSAAANNLIFYPKGIKALNFSSGSPVIELNLGVGNASNQDFEINAIDGELYTNKTYVGYVSSFNKVKIAPRSEAVIPVKIKMSLIGLVSQLVQGLTNGTWSQDLDLSLQANVDNLVVPVGIKYKIGK